MKIKFLLLLVCSMSAFVGFSQEQEDEKKHVFALAFGYTYIPKGAEVEGTEADGVFVPAIGVDYFYRIKPNNIIEIRTYEKGVEQLMLSCSSGSAAVVYHLSNIHSLISPITTSSIGGSLKFTFDEVWKEAFCEGPAELLFSGEFEGNLI